MKIELTPEIIGRYKALVGNMARKYYSRDVLLRTDELEQEGWVVLCEVTERAFDSFKDFEYCFTTSLRNRFRNCVSRNSQKNAILVDLSHCQSVERIQEIYLNSAIKHLRELLSDIGREVFDMMYDQPADVLMIAYKDYVETNRLRHGHKVAYGRNHIKIGMKNLVDALVERRKVLTGRIYDRYYVCEIYKAALREIRAKLTLVFREELEGRVLCRGVVK